MIRLKHANPLNPGFRLTYEVIHYQRTPGGTTVRVDVEVDTYPYQETFTARIRETGPSAPSVGGAIKELGRWLARVGAEMEAAEVEAVIPVRMKVPGIGAEPPGDEETRPMPTEPEVDP